jgi:septum site-determining protein MinD
VLGAEHRVVYDLTDVVQDITKLPQSLIRDRRISTLSLLPASQTRDKDALTEEGVGYVIAKLRDSFDWVICDSPAGIERGALFAMRFADAAVVVTNPEIASVHDSCRIIGILDSQTQQAENKGWLEKHLLITRYDAARATRDETLTIEDILEILAVPLLGVIPESQEVLRASNVGSPITLSNNRSAPARAYVAAAEKLKGEAAVINNKSGLFTKWFGRKDHNAACENLSSTLVARRVSLNVERALRMLDRRLGTRAIQVPDLRGFQEWPSPSLDV